MSYQVKIPSLEVQNQLLELFEKSGYRIHPYKHKLYEWMIITDTNIGGNYSQTEYDKEMSLYDAFVLASNPIGVTIGEYPVKFLKGSVVVGCKTFTNDTVKELLRQMENPIKATDGTEVYFNDDNTVFIEGGGESATIEQVRAIVKLLKN